MDGIPGSVSRSHLPAAVGKSGGPAHGVGLPQACPLAPRVGHRAPPFPGLLFPLLPLAPESPSSSLQPRLPSRRGGALPCESRSLKWGLGSWGCGVHEGAAGPSQRGFLLALGTGSPSGPCTPCTRVWFCPQNGPGQLSRTRAGALGPVGACEGPCHVAPNPPARPSPPRGSPGGSLPSTSVRLSVSLRLSVSVPLCLSLPFSACSVCLSLCLLFSVSVPLCVCLSARLSVLLVDPGAGPGWTHRCGCSGPVRNAWRV